MDELIGACSKMVAIFKFRTITRPNWAPASVYANAM